VPPAIAPHDSPPGVGGAEVAAKRTGLLVAGILRSANLVALKMIYKRLGV